jgi:hypothetical protein
LNTGLNQFPGKLLALFVGMYGVHVYGQIILFDSKGFLLSTFVFVWLIIFGSFTFNSTLRQVITISYRAWHKVLILFFIVYLTINALFYAGYPLSYTLASITSIILPGFFLGVISNIDYSNTLAMNTWLYKLETDNFAMRFYNSVGVLVVLFIIYQIYLFYVNKLGMALVLATVNNEYYQDFGDYFIIFYCGWLAVREYNRKRLQRTDRSYFIFSLVIMIEIVISVLFLQIIGSNKAPLTVVAIGLFYLYFSSEGILMYRLRQLAAIFLISTVGLLAFLGFVDPEIISSLRYFNEAELNGFSNNSSISSRWDQLVGEGTYQLNNNWLFGDLSIENYIHSSLITIQTHTGLIGSLMFWMFFIVQGYYIYFRRDDKFLKSVTLPIVFVSIVSSVFWWLPLWFLAGLIYARK